MALHAVGTPLPSSVRVVRLLGHSADVNVSSFPHCRLLNAIIILDKLGDIGLGFEHWACEPYFKIGWVPKTCMRTEMERGLQLSSHF